MLSFIVVKQKKKLETCQNPKTIAKKNSDIEKNIFIYAMLEFIYIKIFLKDLN